jgi:exopolysaccharide biosynthesis polyprenyl glycosylphosphotransferase
VPERTMTTGPPSKTRQPTHRFRPGSARSAHGRSARVEPGPAPAQLTETVPVPRRRIRLRSRREGQVTGLVDTAALLLAAIAGALLWPPVTSAMVVMYCTTALVFLVNDTRRPRPFGPAALDELRAVVTCTAVGAMAGLTITRLAGESGLHLPFLRLWALYLAAASASRVGLTHYQRYRRSRGSETRPVVIVGGGSVGARVHQRLSEHPEYGMRPVGFVEDDDEMTTALSGVLPHLGTLNELPEVSERSGARQLVVAFPLGSDRRLLEPLRRCEQRGIEIDVIPRMFESLSDRRVLEHVGELPLVRMVRPDPQGFEFALKHALDRILAALMLLLLAPLFLMLVLSVWLSSAEGVLFRQRRIGRDGREFDLLKFSSMRRSSSDAFAPLPGSAPGGVEGEDRRTALGRFLRRTSLDELPQLLNVLRGDMSLVGPRPERPEYVQQFERTLRRYRDRHRVKSGMTGWAQVHGLRGQTSIAKRVEWDNHYIENWSLWLDFKILVLTAFALFARVE